MPADAHDPDADPNADPNADADAGRHTDLDRRLRRAILDLLDRRRPGATICPSDVARDVGEPGSWRDLMEPTRAAAAALVEEGVVEVTQRGRPVDVTSARGPVRIRRVD